MSKVIYKEIPSGKKYTQEQVIEQNDSLLMALEKDMENKMNPDKLAELKAKLNKPAAIVDPFGEEPVAEIVSKRKVSISMGFIGVGHGGSRLAEEFYKTGDYDVVVINTASQDLEHIKIPSTQKLLLSGSLGGAGKDTLFAHQIFQSHIDEIAEFIDENISGNNMNFLCISGGGGTGSGCVETMIPLIEQLGSPIGVIYILPKATEDAKSKANAVETLAKLAKMSSQDKISTLIVVDNARIEQIYGGLSQSKFWSTANSAIVSPIHTFNSLTATSSEFQNLDPSDFGKILMENDCSVCGVVEVENYQDETALAEAMINSLNKNMLAEGFDLKQTRTGGVLVVGSKKALESLPQLNIDYAFSMISEQTNGANIFQGVYAIEDDADSIKIFSWFSGLGLPVGRITSLKEESKQQIAVMAEKEKQRAATMSIGLEEDKVTSIKDEIQRKIQSKKSGFNKLQNSSRDSIIDRRRK